MALLTSVLLPAFAESSGSSGATVPAVWQKQSARLTHFDFDTAYSCRSIKRRYTELLEHLGARNIQVTTPGCDAQRRFADNTIKLRLQFDALATAAALQSDALSAHWETVEIGRDQPKQLSAADCEIIDRFEQKVLPLFAHSVIEKSISCTPRQANESITTLKVSVLKAISSSSNGIRRQAQNQGQN